MKTVITRLFVMALAMMALGTAAFAQANSDISLIITDNGGAGDTLRWGVNTSATNGKDASAPFLEEEQPPAPPDGVFDARWINVGTSNNFGQGVKRNYRLSVDGNQRDTFRLKVQPGSGGYPMTLSWPNLNSYFGTANLRFVDGDGNPFTMDMKSGTSFTFSNPSSNSSTITITTHQPSAPAAGVSASSPLAYGIVSFPTPGTKTDSVTISNTGATNIRVDSVLSSDTHFVVNTPPTFPQTVAPGGSIKVGVTFTADASGSFSGTLAIYHDQAGSPINVPMSATASSGEGIYFIETANQVFDNRQDVYSEYIGMKYSGGTPLQGMQFKLTVPNTTLKLKNVQLGPNVANPLDWNFDYEMINAASGSEVIVLLYGRDTTINFPAGTYDSLFVVNYDVKNIKTCNGTAGADSVDVLMYLHSVQSVLATDLGESAGLGVDNNRDTANFSVFNSSSRGDVNCDDRVDILDLLEMIDVILGRKTFEPWQFNRADLAPWSPTWTPSGVQIFNDANNYGDNQVNVQDVVLIANAILNEEWPDAIQLFKALGEENADGAMTAVPGASIFDVKFIYTITRGGIDVNMNNVVPVKGIQMKLKAEDAPANLDVLLSAAIEKNFTVQKKVVDGEVRILIYSLVGEVFDAGNELLFQLPYSVTSPKSIAVIEPITVGGASNEPLKVEYEVLNLAGVDREEIARSFALTNLPNPFNNGTTITYSLKNASNVTLVVTDAKGAEVARILENVRQDAGDHTAEFNAAQLPSGTYFCTMTVNGVSASQKMIVTR